MLNLAVMLLFVLLFIAGLGAVIYFTTVYTLRAWHCYKNLKIDPVNATKKRDTSFGRAEELKQNFENIIALG